MNIVKCSQCIHKRGFTLVEMAVGAAVFAIIATAVFQTYGGFTNLVSIGKHKILAADLLNEQFELVRNLPYAQVGIQNSIPVGVLEQHVSVVRNNATFEITRTIRNVDDPFDGTIGGTPNDLSPSDSKLVQIEIDCPYCKNFVPVSAVTRVSPKNLETASTNGALFIKVFDGNGVPVPQANIHIQYLNGGVTIDDVTNNQGLYQLVDAPPGVNRWRISATKSGFTTDRTYATSSGNPHPTKPDATVVNQAVTQASFVIDKVSSATIESLTAACATVPNIPFTIQGSKLLGTSPDILKYDQNLTTNGSGATYLSNIEWDTFNISAGGSGWYLAGTNPVLPISILPDSSQTISLIMSNDTPAHLLTIVTDSGNNLPVSGATLTLHNGGGFSETLQSGRGYEEQSDWSGNNFSSTDGNLETNSFPGEIRLLFSLGNYATEGELISNIFDTGTSSNFGNIFWAPTAQPGQTGSDPIKIQIATSPTNNASSTWSYRGPDGSASTFYTVSGSSISNLHSGDRYFRYKIMMSTAHTAFTPTVANIAVTFTSACIPPGQALFSALSNEGYTLDIDAPGYISQSIPVLVNSNWQKQNISLLPQ